MHAKIVLVALIHPLLREALRHLRSSTNSLDEDIQTQSLFREERLLIFALSMAELRLNSVTDIS